MIPLTWIVIGVTVLASFAAWNRPTLLRRWLFNPYEVRTRRQYDRFLLSGLIHNDRGHLLFNMFTLFFFGAAVERYFTAYYGAAGPWVFLVLYVLGIIASSLPTYFKHKNQPYYNSLGASGGVSAVLFSSILFAPLTKLYLFFIPIGIPGFIFGVLYLLYSAYQSKRGGDNINHDAHLWGSVFGVVFTALLVPSAPGSFADQLLGWNPFG
ncbi:MAG: rhomboid family intramembrane serine protease [Catalinimonas sp.]